MKFRFDPRQLLPGSESVVNHLGSLGPTWPASEVLGALADGTIGGPHHVFLGQRESVQRALDLEADHRAALDKPRPVAAASGSASRQTIRALGLIALKPLAAFRGRAHPAHQQISHRLVGIGPVAARVALLPGLEVCGEQQPSAKRRVILGPGRAVVAGADPGPQRGSRRITNRPVLDVETAGRLDGDLQQPPLPQSAAGVVGSKLLHRPPAIDGVDHIHAGMGRMLAAL